MIHKKIHCCEYCVVILLTIKEHPSYLYAKEAVNNRVKDTKKKKTVVATYVKKQCKEFLRIADGKDRQWMISEKKVNQINGILKLLNMPKGLKQGQSIYDCTCGYQWLFYVAVLCTVSRKDPEKRKYETAVLEICRKNFKTYTVAITFIILFITEPQFSKFFSVAPDGALSREVRDAIAETLKSSPLIYEYKEKPRFKILRDSIQFLPTETKYTPLNYTNSRFDGKLPSVFLADEVGALPNSYAIESMRSGQLNILNKLGCIISTKYPTANNPFEDEVDYAKKVLNGYIKDPSIFALLYEPDDPTNWTYDDLVLQQGNPVALEIPEIWEDLLKKRQKAIEMESARENFLTKHCNVIYQGKGTETYIDVNYVKACEVEHIDWQGREVWLGVDLAQTNDNCAVSMVGVDEDDNILADVIAFVPEGRIEEKNKFEHIDYRRFIDQMKCIACGDMIVDYGVIEDFVLAIEDKYGVHVVALGYDRYNAMSSAQKWAQKYTVVEVRQHSDTLHPPTKLLSEKIESGEFKYTHNTLLEINFENAKCTYDNNMNRYVNKKRSAGKVDMVVSLIIAVYLMQQDIIFGDKDFVVQVI